jgi:phospholipase A-2-activating protein
VDGPGDAAQGQVHDGVRYDFGKLGSIGCFALTLVFLQYSEIFAVFNVDIGDGEPIRKLPYNRSGIAHVFLFL